MGAGGGCLDIFTLIYPFSSLSPSLWETARYRLKYCLKGPLSPKQPPIKSRREHGVLRIFQRYFSYFTTKTYVVIPHLNRFNEMVLLMGHNLCFKEVIWRIIPKLSLLPFLSGALFKPGYTKTDLRNRFS